MRRAVMDQRAAGRRRAVTALAVLVSLVATACGSRLPDDVLARVDASGRGNGAGAAALADLGDGGTEDAAAGSEAPTPDAVTEPSGAAASGTATTLATGTGRAATATTAAPTRSGSAAAPVAGSASGCTPGTGTEKGVSQKELKFASVVTASGPLPGATEGAYRGVAAYFAMINSQGGICGRKLTVLKGDDALDPARARGEFIRLEPQVVGFVGNLSVADSGYIDLLKSTGVPYVSSTVDPSGRTLRNVVPKAPEGVISTAPYVYFRNTYPDVKRLGYMLADVGGVAANSPPNEEAMKRAGFEMAYGPAAAKVTDPDYTSHVIRMRSANVDFLYLFAFEINMQVRLARNMRQQNWEPKIKMNNIGYNTKWYDTMGADANGWKSLTTYLPMLNPDEPGKSPALVPFNEWNKRLFPKDQLDLFPVGGWGNAAYLVAALRSIGPDVTRAKLLDALYAVPETNGGGLTPPNKPIGGQTSLCFIVVKAEEGRWQREWPATGFECSIGERYKYK